MKTMQSGFVLGIVLMAVFGLAMVWQANESEIMQETTEFCYRWIDNVDSCHDWAEGILDEHGDVVSRCLSIYDVTDVGVYDCVLRGVFE